MGKVYAELTPLEKGFLSLELATNQSQLAIGDAVRSADSYANTSKAATEATKDFKAALGDSLLPAATESLSIFTDLTAMLTTFIKKRNEIKDAEKAAESGNAGLEQRIVLLKEDLSVENQILEQVKSSRAAQINLSEAQAAIADATVQRQQDIVDGIQNQIDRYRESYARHEAELKLIDYETTKTENLTIIQEEAAKLLAERAEERLTDYEKQNQLLSDQITYYAHYRDVTGVQELLNDLIGERNLLLAEENARLSDLSALEERAVAEQEAAAQKIIDGRVLDSEIEAREARRAEYAANEIADVEAISISYQDLASVGLGAVTSGFVDIGEAMAEGSLGIDSFVALMLDSIASTLSALGSQLAAQAITHLLLGDVAGAALGAAGSAAAYTASGVVSSLAGSYENGGIIPGTSTTGDNLTANVNSGEMVLNKKQQASLFSMANSSGGGGGNYTLSIGEAKFTAYLTTAVQSLVDNGKLRGKSGRL